MTIGNFRNSKFIGNHFEFVLPLKHDTKKTPFCMSSNKLFLKYGLHYNHWVVKSVIKPFDAVAFQKIKALRGVKND